MEELDMFQAIFRKIDEFCWWYMERIQTNAGTKFTPKYFQEGFFVRGVCLVSLSTYHQEMNDQVEVTWQTLQTIKHSIMVHTRVLEKYLHFELMNMTDHIVPVL